MKFQFLSEKLGWVEEETHMNLICSLTGEALTFAQDLPAYIRDDLSSLIRSLGNRFGDHVLPETHRAALWNLQRNAKESLQEYAARTRTMVSKAYPGMQGSQLLEQITVEHMVQGLGDADMAYDVLAQRPDTVLKALDLVQWYECCRSNLHKKSSAIRRIDGDDISDVAVGAAVREVAPNREFVTEERLGVVLSDFRVGIIEDMGKMLNEKLALRRQRSERPHRSSVECYRCREMGHYARECPQAESNRQSLN